MSIHDAVPDTTGPVVLIPSTTPEGQADSRMRLRWCLTPAAIEQLKLHEVDPSEAYLFVSVAGVLGEDEVYAHYSETHRYLVPLTQSELVVWFDYAEANDIFAAVVWSQGGLKSLRRSLLQQTSSGRYRHDVIDEYERRFRYLDLARSLPGTTRLRVDVDARLFGQPPPAWVTRFVGLFYSDPLGRIQCDTRRKAIGAALPRLFGSLVAVPAIELVQALYAGVLLVAGMRGINYSPFRHPYRDGPRDIGRHITSCRWFTDANGEERSPLWWLFNPAVALAVIGVWSLVIWATGWPWFTVLAGAIATFALVLVIGAASMRFAPSIIHRVSEGQRTRARQAESDHRHRLEETLEELSCGHLESRPARVTVSLRWNLLKARLCKPYARVRR